MKVASLVLLEVYDNYRLRDLSPNMIKYIRDLDFPAVLSYRGNVDETLRLLRVIYRTIFAMLDDW